MILSVTLNAAVDHLLIINGLKVHDTNRIKDIQTDAGGKGINLSRVCVDLGTPSIATGFLGGTTGMFIRQVLVSQGVQDEFIEITNETRTNFNVESGDGPPTTFNSKGKEVSSEEWDQLVKKFTNLCKQAQWVAFGGSLPTGIPTDAFRTLGKIAKDQGCKVALDADGESMKLGLEIGPDLIKPNVREAERLLGLELVDKEDSLISAVEQLANKLISLGTSSPLVIISRGKKGAIFWAEKHTYRGESPLVESVSTIGSGDSMIAGILYALHEQKPIEECLKYGLAAGAATATTDGTEIGRAQVVHKLLPQAKVSPIKN